MTINIHKIKKHIIKVLTFWIFPQTLRKQTSRNLKYYFKIGPKPESFLERYRYHKTQNQYIKKFKNIKLPSYKIVSLGCDCFCRTIPTLWGIKPRKIDGEKGYPFDLSNNPLQSIANNLQENFNNYFESLHFNGKHWEITKDAILFCHEPDCGAEHEQTIRERFTRRINNLHETFEDKTPIIFLSHYIPDLIDYNAEEIHNYYNQIYNNLLERRNNKKFVFIIIDYSHKVSSELLDNHIVLFAPPYLPESYVWNHPECRFSSLGLKFEKELIDLLEKKILELNT